MLQERVEIISQYVERLSKGASPSAAPMRALTKLVYKGTAPKDHETLRQVQALIGSLPTADSAEFRQEYMTVRVSASNVKMSHDSCRNTLMYFLLRTSRQ